MENKIKHLEFIQGTINRMANNLFLLKGWSITLIAALFALFVKDANKNSILIIYFPVIIFWILDGYFLSQERLFRDLYDHVRKLPEKKIDFSMDTSRFQKDNGSGWLSCMFSCTALFFYIPLVLILLFMTYFFNKL